MNTKVAFKENSAILSSLDPLEEWPEKQELFLFVFKMFFFLVSQNEYLI